MTGNIGYFIMVGLYVGILVVMLIVLIVYVVEALTERYRWHWLKLNADDLPDEGSAILMLTEVGTALGQRDGKNWTSDGGDDLPKPLAWQYVNLPEMPEDDGPDAEESE